jgi:hypothetical protein
MFDDPRERFVVGRVGEQAQVGDGVFDLGARVEAERARHLIGKPVGGQRLLEGLRLAVCPVEDRDVGEGAAGVAMRAGDLDVEGGLVV